MKILENGLLKDVATTAGLTVLTGVATVGTILISFKTIGSAGKMMSSIADLRSGIKEDETEENSELQSEE